MILHDFKKKNRKNIRYDFNRKGNYKDKWKVYRVL